MTKSVTMQHFADVIPPPTPVSRPTHYHFVHFSPAVRIWITSTVVNHEIWEVIIQNNKQTVNRSETINSLACFDFREEKINLLCQCHYYRDTLTWVTSSSVFSPGRNRHGTSALVNYPTQQTNPKPVST